MTNRFISTDENDINFTQCVECRHYHDNSENFSCKAFPNGIPEDILNGDFDHREEYPHDNGIRFEPMEAG